jgi:hypothetical protein
MAALVPDLVVRRLGKKGDRVKAYILPELDLWRAGFLKAHNIDELDWEAKRKVPEYMVVGKKAGVRDVREGAAVG